jgi:hypothetical protein
MKPPRDGAENGWAMAITCVHGQAIRFLSITAKLLLISRGSDDSTLILDPAEAPSALAALGLIDAQLPSL